ncbi:MAG: cobalt-precorrin 5A hydrolase [Methanoculleaceae archaeon]
MSTVVCALPRFRETAEEIAAHLSADYVDLRPGVMASLFRSYREIVLVMAVGIAVRAIAPHLTDKWRDPAVVVVGPDRRYVIPIIGGHHGANTLARRLGDMGITPVITTATEAFGRRSVERIAGEEGYTILNRESTRRVNAAILDGDVPVYNLQAPGIAIVPPGISVLVRRGGYVVGIGCRRGVPACEIREAISATLDVAGINPDSVLVYATTSRKRDEPGLAEAVASLGGVLVYLPDSALRSSGTTSPSRAEIIGLPGVAEPAALALSQNGELIRPKVVHGRVTVAIAR